MHAVLIARWHCAVQHLRACDLHVLYALLTQCMWHICSTYAVHTPCMCCADQADHCDKDSIAVVTASLVNDVHSILTSLSGSSSRPLPIPSEAMQAVKSVNPDSIVLMSHSAGAVTAVDMLAGKLYLCLLLPFSAFSCPPLSSTPFKCLLILLLLLVLLLLLLYVASIVQCLSRPPGRLRSIEGCSC